AGRGLGYLKKGGHLLREEPKVARFEFILEHQHLFSLIRMVAVLQVSRSGYYAWRKSGLTPSPRALKRAERYVLIKEAFEYSKARYVSRRIHVDLSVIGHITDIQTILYSM